VGGVTAAFYAASEDRPNFGRVPAEAKAFVRVHLRYLREWSSESINSGFWANNRHSEVETLEGVKFSTYGLPVTRPQLSGTGRREFWVESHFPIAAESALS
jgi:hypothetical protein